MRVRARRCKTNQLDRGRESSLEHKPGPSALRPAALALPDAIGRQRA